VTNSVASRVVALVPCKDGASSIGETVEALLSEPSVDVVMVIDDGSTDATATVAAAAGARVLRLPNNSGKGGALKAGVDATPEADVYLLVDADTRATAAETVHLLPPVLRDEADLVIGVLPSAGGRGGFGIVRDVAAKGIQRATGFEMNAPLSGQRAIRASLLRRLELAPRFGVEVGMTIDAINTGARVTERDVVMEHRHHGRTVNGFVHRGRQGWDVVAALRPRLVPGAWRLGILVAVTAFLAGLFLASWSTPPRGVAPASTTSLPQVNEVDVILVPGWSWRDVKRRGDDIIDFNATGNTLNPSGPSLVGSVATGKVEDIVRAVQLGTRDDERTEVNSSVNVIVRPQGLTRDETYAKARIVMGVTLAGQDAELRPIVLQGIEQSGSFASASTKRAGIVDLTDIAPTVMAMQGMQAPAGSAQPLRALESNHPVETAASTEERVRFFDHHRPAFISAYAVLHMLAYGYLWFRRKAQAPPRASALLAPLLAAVPLATLLTQWFSWNKSPSLVGWSASFVLTLGIIVAMSGLASRNTIAPLQRVLVATVLVIAVDVLAGGYLQLGGFFGSTPALGARYYGMGNVATVLTITASVLGSALHVRAGELIGPQARRSAWWRAVAACTLVAVLIGAPGLGADVGGLFTAAVVFTALFTALFSVLWSGRLPLRSLVIITLAGMAIIVLAGIVDAQRAAAEQTHLGRLFAQIGNEGFAPLWQVVVRKLEANVMAYAYPWSLLIVAAATAGAIALLRGHWAGSLPRKSCERIGAIAALIGSGVAYGVNDSGIVTLVLAAVFLGPFLMVFYRHNRWDIPKLEVFRP
jgi:hypothetical protein